MRLPIPQYQRQAVASAGGTPPMARDVGMGGVLDAAGAIARAGAEREQVADQQLQAFQRLQHEQAKARNVERVSAARLEWAQAAIDRQAKAGPEATEFTGRLLGDFDKWAEKSGQAIADEDERRMFTGMLGGLRDHLMGSGLQFEAGARRTYRKQVLADGIDTDSRAVMADPGQTMDVLAQRLAAINQSGDLDAAERAALSQRAREAIVFNAGAVLAQRDPDGWLKRDPRADPIKARMDPAHIMRLDNAAQAEIDQRKSQAMAGQDKAIRMAQQELDGLRTFVMDGGTVSPEYEARVMATAGAAPGMGDAARALVDMSRKGAGFASMPLARQREALRQFQPGDPEQAKLKAHMQAVTERQATAYRENPWAAAEQFGRGVRPVSPAVQLTAAEQLPELVASRAQVAPGVEVMSGEAVPLIRPEEVSQAQALLASKPIEQRAEILAAMGRSMTPERLAKTAELLDKGDRPTALMLMAAGDRTSAGVAVATRIGQGAQAIKDKAVKKDDSALTGWRSEIAALIRPVIKDARAADAAIDAAYYVRAAMETEAYGSQFNSIGNRQAAELVVGRILDRSGMQTLLPRGVEVVDLDRKLLEYTPQRLAAMGPLFIGGKPATPEYVAGRLRTMGLQRFSDGRMVPFHNGAAVTLDKESTRPLFLEVK